MSPCLLPPASCLLPRAPPLSHAFSLVPFLSCLPVSRNARNASSPVGLQRLRLLTILVNLSNFIALVSLSIAAFPTHRPPSVVGADGEGRTAAPTHGTRSSRAIAPGSPPASARGTAPPAARVVTAIDANASCYESAMLQQSGGEERSGGQVGGGQVGGGQGSDRPAASLEPPADTSPAASGCTSATTTSASAASSASAAAPSASSAAVAGSAAALGGEAHASGDGEPASAQRPIATTNDGSKRGSSVHPQPSPRNASASMGQVATQALPPLNLTMPTGGLAAAATERRQQQQQQQSLPSASASSTATPGTTPSQLPPLRPSRGMANRLRGSSSRNRIHVPAARFEHEL